MGLWKSVLRPFRLLRQGLRRWLRPPDYRRLLRRIDALERNLERVLLMRYPELGPEVGPREALRRHEFKVHSQNGEDGLLLRIFSTIGVTERRVVEFGIQDGRECNAANLILNYGWGGLLMDLGEGYVRAARAFYHEERGVPEERLKIEQERMTAENANTVLERHGIKGEIDLLSIDIDSNDYWVWKAIRAVEPRVVVIEYNASLDPGKRLICEYDPDFDARARHPRGWYHGASLGALALLAERRGYSLVGCESAGVNAFFVRSDLARGRLPELLPEEAYYPHARRLRHASPAEQYAQLEKLRFGRDDSVGGDA
jgi:hypothetical protein